MQSHQNSPDTAGTGNFNPLKWVMFALAFLLMIVIKPSQILRKHAYEDSYTFIPRLLGLIASAAAGIIAGSTTHTMGMSMAWWLPIGLTSLLATYHYIWPLLYLAIFKWSFKVGEFFWARVPEPDLTQPNKYGISPWLSQLLTGIAVFTTIGGATYLAYDLATHIHLSFAGGSSLISFFGWIVSIVVGAVIAIMGAALVLALIGKGIVAIAGVLGLFMGMVLHPAVVAYVGAPQGANLLTTVIEVTGFVIWMSYIFPAAHLAISIIFRPLGEWLVKAIKQTFVFFATYFDDFLASVYDDRDHNYVRFTRHVLNLALTALVGYLAWPVVTTDGFSVATGFFLAIPMGATYLIAGRILLSINSFVLSLLLSLLAASKVFFLAPMFGVPFGVFGAILASALSVILLILLVIPVLYKVSKLFANPLLASWLGAPLDKLHSTLCEEVFNAVDHTYEDRSDFANLFAHVCNIKLTLMAYSGMTMLLTVVTLSPLSTTALPLTVAVAVYLAGGKLLPHYGNVLIGVLLAASLGTACGVIYYNDQHALPGAILIFAISAAVLYAAILPVTYVISRAILMPLRVTSWALPVFSGIHGFFFGFIAAFWRGVVAAYRAIENAWIPAWRAVTKLWDEAWTGAMKTWKDAWQAAKDSLPDWFK